MSRSREILVLVLLWSIVTACNLTKAFHIDDTAHLSIAEAIKASPLHAMDAEFNWLETATPIHTMNQPHLFFYLLAGFMSWFGESEVILHSLLALFSALAIVVFWQIASKITSRPFLLTALFCISPAFIPSQNIMVDVPLLSIWLIFFNQLLSDPETSPRSHVFAALALAGALLMKYTSLVLLPILILDIAMKRRWREMWVVLLPILALAAWSAFNYWSYGGIHLVERHASGYSVGRMLIRTAAWVICLGSMLPWLFVTSLQPLSRRRRRFAAIGLGLGAGLATLAGSFLFDEPLNRSILRAIFATAGLSFLTHLATRAFGMLRASPSPVNRHSILLFSWIAATSVFIVLFSPAVAVRHILLVTPAVLLLVAPALEVLNKTLLHLLVGMHFILAGAAGASDYVYAETYRRSAAKLIAEFGTEGVTWFTGHWGWMWYAQQAGLRQYDLVYSKPRAGDILVAPENIDKQPLTESHKLRLRLVDQVEAPSTPSTFFRVGHPAGYYASSIRRLPWEFCSEPTETFLIYQFE